MSGPIRRILVAVDASPLSLAAAEAACRLAGRLGAQLEALFVEDINVVRLVAHPFVHTISLAAARRQSADDTLIGKALELQMVAARRALEAAMAASGTHGAFTVRRGRVEAELLEAARSCDLVCLGWSGRADPGARPRLGSVARAVTEAAAGSVLLLQKPSAGPVCLWWDGDGKGLEMAAGLAVQDGGRVDVLVPATDRIEGTRRGVDAVEALQRRGVRAGLRAVGRPTTLLAALPADAVLVLPADVGLTLDDLPCSAVVVR
ncbi:MAG: universal stress protein [Magnetospirillum sp.]|nr:universal stress protein [Magnetospirillum sp.]